MFLTRCLVAATFVGQGPPNWGEIVSFAATVRIQSADFCSRSPLADISRGAHFSQQMREMWHPALR
jgi:hypothetical protein